MHVAIARAKLAAEDNVISSGKVRYFTTCPLYDKDAGSYIPGIKVVFKKSFESSACYIGKVDGSASQPPDSMCFFQKLSDDIQVSFLFFKVIIGEASGEQTFLKRCNI